MGEFFERHVRRILKLKRMPALCYPSLIKKLCIRAGVDMSQFEMDLPMGSPIYLPKKEPPQEYIFRLLPENDDGPEESAVQPPSESSSSSSSDDQSGRPKRNPSAKPRPKRGVAKVTGGRKQAEQPRRQVTPPPQDEPSEGAPSVQQPSQPRRKLSPLAADIRARSQTAQPLQTQEPSSGIDKLADRFLTAQERQHQLWEAVMKEREEERKERAAEKEKEREERAAEAKDKAEERKLLVEQMMWEREQREKDREAQDRLLAANQALQERLLQILEKKEPEKKRKDSGSEGGPKKKKK